MIHLSKAEAARYGLHSRGLPNSASEPRSRPKRDKGQPKGQSLATRLIFCTECRAHGLPEPKFEFQFAPPRKWRFDYLFGSTVAVEREGGAFCGGRHTRGAGFRADLEKYNQATLLGFHVLRFLPEQFDDGSAFETIKRALEFLDQ